LIALISNARHFIVAARSPLEGRPSVPTTRQGEHCSERPEVEINPYRTAGCGPAPCGTQTVVCARRISSLRCP
jgi:hypothetical protein